MRPQPSRRLRRAYADAQVIAVYIAGMSFDEYQRDTRTSDAVERRLETLCEAVSLLVRDLPGLMTEIPEVRLIGGLRNQLAHGYLDLQLDLIWSTVTEDVPKLADVLKLLTALSDDEINEKYSE